MTATMEVNDPDEIKITMDLTMTLKEWKLFKDQQLHGDWPSSDVIRYINDMVHQVEGRFYGKL